MIIYATDIRKGTAFELNGSIMKVLDFQPVRAGKGMAFVRVEMKDLRSGRVVTERFVQNEKFQQVNLERKPAEFMFDDGENFFFMDVDTYDMHPVKAEVLGDTILYLMENEKYTVCCLNGEIVDIEPQPTMVMRIESVETDRADGANMPATLTTGLVIRVPLHVKPGDRIQVDTRYREYLGLADR